MQIRIALEEDATPAGLRSIAYEWEADYPKATLVSMYNVERDDQQKLVVSLALPPDTQIIQPQHVDMSTTSVE